MTVNEGGRVATSVVSEQSQKSSIYDNNQCLIDHYLYNHIEMTEYSTVPITNLHMTTNDVVIENSKII